MGLKQLMKHKQIFLIKLCTFKALVEKCSRIGMESGRNESISANEAQKLQQLELNLQKKLGSFTELFESQIRARISVPNVDVQQMIGDLLVGSGDGRSASPSNHFLTLSSELQCSMERPVERFDPAELSPVQFLGRIAQSIASENGSLNELKQLSSSNPISSTIGQCH